MEEREVPLLLGNGRNQQRFSAAGRAKRDTHKKHNEAQMPEAEVTSMMVRNLPFNLTQQKLIDALDATGFAGLYDFCYLPHKFRDHKNVGYAFVNFVNPTAAQEFKRKWHQDKGTVFKTSDMRKALNVTDAELQGRQANMRKANSKKMCRVRNDSFKPVLLSSQIC